MFGESIPNDVKSAAEHAVNEASSILVVGSSLATYSAWRLAKQATERGMGVGVVNVGGVRKEEGFFPPLAESVGVNGGGEGKGRERRSVRVSLPSEEVLPGVVQMLSKPGI